MMKAWFEARGYRVHIVDPVKQLLAKAVILSLLLKLKNQQNVLMQQISKKIKWC